MTTILVVAPTGRARAGLAGLLAERKTFHVIVAPADVALPDLVEGAQPDVVLVDLGSGPAVAALRHLGRIEGPSALIVLADDPHGAIAAGALRAGARGVLPRHAAASEIIAAIDATTAGLVALHPEALEPGPAPHRLTAADAAPAPLTPREAEVLGMMAEGLGNKIIAARLGISGHTVKFHVAAIFTKLGAGSRTEAVTIGLRQGLILI